MHTLAEEIIRLNYSYKAALAGGVCVWFLDGSLNSWVSGWDLGSPWRAVVFPLPIGDAAPALAPPLQPGMSSGGGLCP